MHMRFHTMEILFKLLLIPAYGKTVSVTSDDYGLFLVHFFILVCTAKTVLCYTVYVLCMVSVLCSLFSNQLKKIKFCI